MLFHLFCFCSQELATNVPLTLAGPQNTRQAAVSYDYHVAIGNSRVGHFDECFFPYLKLWNSLPSHSGNFVWKLVGIVILQEPLTMSTPLECILQLRKNQTQQMLTI